MKKINLIEMLQGCSKRNGTTFRQSNPDGQPTVNRQSRLMSHRGYLKNLAMIFAVLVMSMANIGMAWGASVAEGTYNFVDQTIGAVTKFYKIDNGIYQYRLDAYTRNTSYGIQLPASGDGTGFAFHLESTQKVYLGICKKSQKNAITNNLYIKTITKANFDAIEAGSNNSTTVTLTLGGSATLSQNYTFAALGSAKTEGATVYMGELPAGYYYAYGNSTGGNGNLYSISFGTQTLFLVPNDKTASSAKFAIYYFPGNSGYECQGWSDYMTVSPCNSSTYRADIPKGYTKVIFVRLDPSKGKNWDGKWNQTGNLTFDGSKDLFTWANNSWDGVTKTWSASTKYTISFAANGGSGSMSNVSSIACGRSVTLAANAYEKSGYVFAGWKTNVAVTANGEAVAANGIVADGATISNISSNITLTAQWNADVACTATQPGALSKGTLSGCSRTITASGSAAPNNTWYWQSSLSGTDKSDEYTSGKAITAAGTYYLRSFCSDGAGCWSDPVSVEITAADMTPSAPTALTKSSIKAKGVTLTVEDVANTNDYEFYVSTASTDPVAGTTATHSSNTKSITITNLYAGTTFYAWARAKCGSNKSAWTALTGSTFTTSTVTMTPTLTNVTHTSGATSGIGGSNYTAVFTANTGYSMPNPTVTIGGNAATIVTDYTWSVDGSVGTITIPANKINGNIVITLNSVPSAPSSAVISGTYHYFPGDNISLTCTPSGNNGPTTYQWYKGGKADVNRIAGATSATYTKATCAFDDAGSYYCKVTCNATSIWANTNSSENYDVKILRLYVNGSKGGEHYGYVDFVKLNATTATASISLGSNWTYGFNIADGCGHYYGNEGTMQENNCTNWTTNVSGTDCGLTTTNAATYTFTINYSNLGAIVTSVTFPVANQAAGKVIYFDNNVLKWTGSSIYYRIGHSSHTQADQLSLVPGTANLYKMTTREYNGFFAWQIGNAEGGNGSGKSIYNTQNTPAITASIAYEGASVTADAVTVTPGVDHSTGGDAQNNNCEFYSKTITNGMKRDRVTITAPVNGTITVNYTSEENVASSFSATTVDMYQDLAHTVKLTSITAVANTGYDAGAITINGDPYSANYVVTGATTIAATFTPHVYSITLNKGDHGAANQSATVAYLAGELTSITHVTPNTGYTLTGYYDGETKVLNANGTFASANVTGYITDSKWTKTSDATLTAKWTPDVVGHTVTYDAQGGTCKASDTGSSITLPAPTKDDYTFQGWYTSGGELVSSPYSPTADITLHALWRSDECAGGGGGSTTLFNVDFTDETTEQIKASTSGASWVAKTYDSYSMSFGSKNADAGVIDIINEKGLQFTGNNLNSYNCLAIPLSLTKDKEVTAVITLGDATKIGYKWVSGSLPATPSVSSPSTYETNSTTNTLTYTPTSTGNYVLYLGRSGSSSGKVVESIVITQAGGGSPTCYYVTYNGNGADGGFTTDEASHPSGSNVTVKTNGFTKTGYRFTGWKTEPSGGTSYAAGDAISGISGNMTLYAQWSECTAPTASWVAHPGTATIGDGGQTYTISTDATNTVVWTIEDQEGATSATLSSTSGLSTTLSGYTTAGSLYIQAAITGDGIHYLSTPATLLRQRVVISADCEETTLISATLSSCTGTGAVTGTPGGTSTVAFESCESMDGGYKMGKDGSYMRLALTSGNFAANDEVKITITKASNVGDGALHIYKYAGEAWTELGSVTAAGAGTHTYRLTESNVSTPFNTIGLYRTGKNQNPYVKALSVVRNSCSASKPSGITVTATPAGPYAIGATPTLTVTATNAETYQWYSNTNNTASDGFLLVGETATTYSPSTAIAGTTYYYCVATNASGSTVSNIIEVTVNSDKSTPEVSWTDTDETPNYGGGGYTVKATVSTGAWDGTLTTDMLTASDGVTLSGISVAGKVITATYGVTETARSPLSFSLTLPETTNYTALAANKEITFTRCGEGEVIETTETPLPVLKDYTTVNNVYRWATADVGWFTLETGASSISSESSSYSGFSYRSKSGKKYVLLYSELDAVKAVRLYVNGTGDNTTLSKVKTGTTYNKYKELEESTDYDFTYSNSSTSIASRENAYIEISFKTNLTANTFVEITLSRNTLYYGAELLTGSTEVGTIDTDISWATDPGATVNKKTTDANFRYEAVKASDAASQATLGTISYKSSNTSVATVSATGVVDVLSEGTTTITATLAGSGCYKKATKSYTLNVEAATCTDVAGTITASGEGITIDGNTVTKTDACANVTLTVNGHTGDGAGATYQWYKDGVSMGDGYRAKSATVTANGDYTVEVTNAGDEHCAMPATNTITITGNAISITKIVDEWYVKNGRRTPDIALATIKGTTSWKVNDGSGDIWVVSDGEATTTTGFGECGFILRDSTIYLRGSQDDGNEPTGLSEGNVTLTITAVRDCAGENPNVSITIHKQAANTSKPSIAFIVDGTSGSPVNEVAGTKTSSRPIWVYLSTYFDLTGCNAYWTNNEKLIRQYYSQFDAIVITDDPNTGTGPNSGKKYVNALGTMVDIRPILTMEAFVGKYGAESNWHIGGTPSSPNPRQYELKLQCKDHDIYADLTPGANFRSEEIGGETYYYVTMVDNSVTPYVGVADDKQTEDYPALQGFSAAAIKGTGLLGIGTISDGTLQGGVERQEEPTARMMILGIQHQAMAALTSEGKQIIKNAIEYLLKTNMEDVNDCSSYFIGTTDNDWNKASNWSSNKLPDASTKARILAPVTVSTKAHVAQLDIAVSGRSIHYNNGETECSGRVTINPNGALIVEGPVRRTTTGRLFTEEELKPIQIEDMTIGSDAANGNGTLIFDNSEGESQAIVQYYSRANTNENDEWNWQYMAVPFNDNSSAYRNYYDSYLYRWKEDCSGWEVVPNRGEVYPWVGYTITQVGDKTYTMDGTLVETGEQTFSVPAGKNLVLGNSWTAPIQVKQFTDDDFEHMSKNVYLFNTGYDPEGKGSFSGTRYEGGTYVTIPIHSSTYSGDSLISSLQAFIVYAKADEGGGTFTLDYDRHVRPARSTDKVNAGPMHAPKRGGAIEEKPAVLKVWASGSRYDDRLIVLEREDFSTGLDEGWDGNKRVAGKSSPLIFAVTDNGREAVSAIPTMEGTLIGFWAGEDNEYTLHFEYNEEDELYLLDLDNNIYTPVNSSSTYVFTVPDKKAHNRFILTRIAPDPVATGVEETQASEKPEAKAIKFLKDEKVFIFVNGKLYDATGKVVK